MADYSHPSIPGFRGRGAFTLPIEVNGQTDDVSFVRGWWNDASAEEIAALGFVEYVPPPLAEGEPTNRDVNAERERRLQAVPPSRFPALLTRCR